MDRLTTGRDGLNVWGVLALVLFSGAIYVVFNGAGFVVRSYGFWGFAITIAGIFAIGFLIEARTKSRRSG